MHNFGGWSALQSYTNHTVSYNTTTGAVTNLAPMPKAVANSVAALNNGMILVAGGRIAGGAAVATLYQYDVQHNTWSTLASMPKGVYQAMGAMDSSGKLWVAGGYNSTDGAPTNIVQIYDPTSNSWSTGTPLPTATYKGVGFNADGNIYVAGGVDSGNQFLSNVYAMAPNGSSWAAKTAMPIANSLMGVALGKDNQAYVMGGSPSASGNFDTALNSTYIYNPDSNAWSSGPALPDKVVSASAASTSDGTAWRIGGITASSLVSKNVSALTVMSINETVSPSTPIGTGQNLAVTVAVDAPFRSLSSFQGTAVLVDGTGSAYASQSFTSGTSTTVHIVMTVPQIAPPGTYRVSFVDTVMHDANGSSFATDLKNVSFPVISSGIGPGPDRRAAGQPDAGAERREHQRRDDLGAPVTDRRIADAADVPAGERHRPQVLGRFEDGPEPGRAGIGAGHDRLHSSGRPAGDDHEEEQRPAVPIKAKRGGSPRPFSYRSKSSLTGRSQKNRPGHP